MSEANNKFAVLLELPETQFLAYVEYDHDEDQTILHHIFSVDGARADIALRFDGEDQEQKAANALANVDEGHAQEIIDIAKGMTCKS